MIIQKQTNLRLRPSHRTLLGVLTEETAYRSYTTLAESATRLAAEAVIQIRLSQGCWDARTEVLLSALIAAAQEACPIPNGLWYRISADGRRLQTWSGEQQGYLDVQGTPQLPQSPLRQR